MKKKRKPIKYCMEIKNNYDFFEWIDKFYSNEEILLEQLDGSIIVINNDYMNGRKSRKYASLHDYVRKEVLYSSSRNINREVNDIKNNKYNDDINIFKFYKPNTINVYLIEY